MAMFKITREQAEESIYDPEDDPGEWAPNSLAILNLETGDLDPISYNSRNGFDNCFKLARRAGTGYIEYVNPAVAAVYDA